MTLIVDEVMLREPNLLIPGKKPVGPVKIDWSHPLTNKLKHAFILSHLTGYRDLVSGILPTTNVATTIDNKGAFHNTGYLNYPTPDWINSGVTNATFFYRSNGSNLTSGRSGFGFHAYGATGSRFGVVIYQDDIYFSADIAGTLKSVIVSTGWPLYVTTDLAARYDGTLSTASERYVGYINGAEYTSGDAFPASMETNYSRLYLGAYGYGSVAYYNINTSEIGYIWNRTLSTAELESIRFDPYQFLIPA